MIISNPKIFMMKKEFKFTLKKNLKNCLKLFVKSTKEIVQFFAGFVMNLYVVNISVS